MELEIYTDGSCLNNPGPGGWAALLRYNGEDIRIQGGAPHTTNNRMELTAAIEALQYAQENMANASPIHIYSDSSWVVNTMTKNWKRKKNLDLWERLMPLVQEKEITWNWVKGHAGHPENEDCDQRALKKAEEFQAIADDMNPLDLTLPGDPPSLF